jgi:hypothetical protein
LVLDLFKDPVSTEHVISFQLPALLYGSENWTIKAREATRIAVAEMKYMRKIAGHIWEDYETKTEIAKEINITPILDKIQEYKNNCLQHVSRIHSNR